MGVRVEVWRRQISDYPKRDLTPEHTKRRAVPDRFSNAPLHQDVAAAYDYVDRVMDAADLKVGGATAWYGWALREAFLAGVSHAENRPLPPALPAGGPVDAVVGPQKNGE